MLKRIKSAITKPSVNGKVPALITLEGNGYHDRRIVGIPVHKLFAVASDGEKVRVYKSESGHESGRAVRVFAKHENEKLHPIMGLEHLCDDIMASVDAKGILYTWKATNCTAVEYLKIQAPRISENNFKISCMTKIDDATLVIGTETGQLIIVTHEKGTNLSVHAQLMNEHIDCIYSLTSYGNLLVALTRTDDTYIWRWTTEDELISYKRLRSPAKRGCVTISDRFLVSGHENGYIYVRCTVGDFAIALSINLNSVISSQNAQVSIVALGFVHSDLIVATSESHGIFFLSLTSVECVGHLMPSLGDHARLTTATILGGESGRIAVGSNGKCGIFPAPQRVEDDVIECGQVLYEPILSVLPLFSPFQGAWKAIEENKVSLVDVVKVASNPIYTSSSISEWVHAHYLLMTAVRRGEILNENAKIDKRNEVNWWCNLYYPVTSLQMGEKDVSIVQRFIKEAEIAGVIDASNAKTFKTSDLRNVCIKNASVLTSTLVELFARQLIMHTRIREVLLYKKLQMGMDLVLALIECMPMPIIGRGVARRMSDEHSVLLEGFNLDDLMDLFFSVGKTAWSSFISEIAVERFACAVTEILGDSLWNRVPKPLQHKVEDALDKLKISRKILHGRLQTISHVAGISASRPASIDRPLAPVAKEQKPEEAQIAAGSVRRGSRGKINGRPSQAVIRTEKKCEESKKVILEHENNLVRRDTRDLLGNNLSFEVVDTESVASLLPDVETSETSKEESEKVRRLYTTVELQKSELDVLKLELEESRQQYTFAKSEMARLRSDFEGSRKEVSELRQIIEDGERYRREEAERNQNFRNQTDQKYIDLKIKMKEISYKLDQGDSYSQMSVRSDRSVPGSGLVRKILNKD